MGASIKKVFLNVFLGLFILVSIFFFGGHSLRRVVFSSADGSNSFSEPYASTDNVDYGFRASTNLFPLRRSISEETRILLGHQYEKIVAAYSSQQLDVMVELYKQTEEQILDLHDHIYNELERPLSMAFNNAFLRQENLKDFASVSAFSEFAKINMKMAHLLCGTSLRRKDCSVSILYIERWVLCRLQQYHEMFSRKGRMDLERCARGLVADWISHIESENGYTRNYMLLYRDIQFEGVLSRNQKLTSEIKNRILQVVREEATSLVNTGYTPKWLDEEFPSPVFAEQRR